MRLALNVSGRGEDVASLRDELNRLFAEVRVRLWGVEERAAISGTSSAVAGGATYINHTLGRIPTGVHLEPQADTRWYVTEANRLLWSATRIVVTFSAASVKYRGYVTYLED